jgi:S1/P1 Nuclease
MNVLAAHLLLFLSLCIPSSLYAWGREAHHIVAIIAEQRLRADVREAANTLLEGKPFIEASTWADEVRTDQTAPWHYVNIPITDSEYDAERVCPK